MSIARGNRPPSSHDPLTGAMPEGAHGPTKKHFERSGHLARSDEATLEWFATAQLVGRDIDLDLSAHAYGAMLRRRGVPAATNLLCLSLMHGPGRMPLRMVAERAEEHAIAYVSEPALLRRLCNAADWLEHLANELIAIGLRRHGKPLAPEIAALPSMVKFGNGTRLLPGTPMKTQTSDQPAVQLQEHHVTAARAFIVQFVPWPNNVFSDAQVHWLLCARWTFVSSSLRDLPGRIDDQATPTTALERSRMQSHLIAALQSGKD